MRGIRSDSSDKIVGDIQKAMRDRPAQVFKRCWSHLVLNLFYFLDVDLFSVTERCKLATAMSVP